MRLSRGGRGRNVFWLISIMWVPRFRLLAPLRGSTQRRRRDLGTHITISIRNGFHQPNGREATRPNANLPPNGRDSRTLQQIRTSQNNKNFPSGPRHHKKRNKFSLRKWRGPEGKFSVSEGGLEGESPVFQEGALSLQGLSPLPPRSFLYPRPLAHNSRTGHSPHFGARAVQMSRPKRTSR